MVAEVLDLFSAAAGGWSLGMHRAGFTTIAACEVIDWRRALYSENNPNVRMYDDVRTLTAKRLRDDLGRLPSVVVGSPPCQDISVANTRGRGVEGEKSSLFFEAARLIGEIRPRWFALENSDRVRTRGYDQIAAALEAYDYHCWPLVVGVGNAGGSHMRKRAWILGMDANASCAGGEQEGWRGTWRRWSRCEEAGRRAGDSLGTDANRIELRIERGIGEGWLPDGKEEIVAGLSRVFRGPVGSSDLSSHLRAYDGLPGRVAEQCREAYGDAVAPQITEAIGRAILRTEAALAAVATDTTPSRDEEGSVGREAIARVRENAFAPLGSPIPEARVSLLARAVRHSLRSYGHRSAESSLPECIASDVEAALKTSTPETQTVEGGEQ